MPETEKKLSCGIVIARQYDVGWLTLLLRAYHNWDFPKGLCEDGEQPLQAATREVHEETGITELQFEWGDRDHPKLRFNPFFQVPMICRAHTTTSRTRGDDRSYA